MLGQSHCYTRGDHQTATFTSLAFAHQRSMRTFDSTDSQVDVSLAGKLLLFFCSLSADGTTKDKRLRTQSKFDHPLRKRRIQVIGMPRKPPH